VRDDRLRRPFAQQSGAVAGLHGQRDDVLLRLAQGELHPHDGEAHRAERRHVEHPHAGQVAVAAGEPAPALDVSGSTCSSSARSDAAASTPAGTSTAGGWYAASRATSAAALGSSSENQ